MALNASVTNPFYIAGGPGLLGSPTISKAQSLRPFPAFGDINLLYSDQNKARYDSLAIRGQKLGLVIGQGAVRRRLRFDMA